MVTGTHRSNDQIRSLILKYLYERNSSATSARGKRGAAVKIGDMRRELKTRHDLSREEVVSNLTYLISQGWAEKQVEERVVPIVGGHQIPSKTPYFIITAAGIDKIEGPSEFTRRDRFAGIDIQAGNQCTVFVGDGNQVDVKYQRQGEALAQLSDAIKRSHELTTAQIKEAVIDVDVIQTELARSIPKADRIKDTWASVAPLASFASLTNSVLAAAEHLASFLQ